MSDYSTMSLRKIAGVRCALVLLGILIFPCGVLMQRAVCDDKQIGSGEKSTAASDDDKPRNSVPAPPLDKVAAQVPELVYLTWQKSKTGDGKRALNTLWNMKDEVVPLEEAKKAVLGTNSFNVHWWHPEEELRPLVLVFRVDPNFESNVFTTVIDDRRRRHIMGTYAAGKIPGWSVSAAAPLKGELAEWPKQISLEIRYPIEKDQLLKTIDKIPDTPVQIADGIEWSIENNRGLRDQKPAAVLRCELGRGDWQLHKYHVECYLRGKYEPLGGAYATAEAKA